MKTRGRKKGKYSYSESELLNKLKEATKLVGHSIGEKEFRSLKSFPGSTVYRRRFGSWVKAKKLAGLKLITHKEAGERALITKMDRYNFKRKSKVSLKTRFEIFQRDNFTCQYCGRNPQNGAVIVIDHIIPLAKQGEGTINNLITSCFECNSGKKDILLENHWAIKKRATK